MKQEQIKNPRNDRIVKLLNRRQIDLTVFMDEVHKSHNLSAIVRTCDAVGIGDVHAVYPEVGIKKCRGITMGSGDWVTTHTHKDLKQGLNQIKQPGQQVLAAHFSDRAVDFRKIDYTKPTILLVGSEKFGVSERAAELADEHILIPMLGMVQSLNVSVAAAIILYEAQRQREAAGLYDKRQLDDSVCEALRFDWLYPRIKSFCDMNNIRYPSIDHNGEIDDDEWQQLRYSLIKHSLASY